MSSSRWHNPSIDNNRRSWHKKSQLVDSLGAQYQAFTHDISHSGMSLFVDKQYPPGQVCQVNVPVFAGPTLRHYQFHCRVILSSLCGLQGFRTNLAFVEVSAENRALIQSVMAN